MRDFNDQARPPPDGVKDLARMVQSVSHRHGAWQVFSDFAEMAAISLSNAVDRAQAETREARYMEVIKRYSREELAKFPEMLAALVNALEEEPSDVMGRTFHELELHNKWAGQFFSPYPLCRMMAKMTLSDTADLEARISDRGFVTASEPAVGSGAMVIALAHEMHEAGINYQQHLHVTAVDVDLKCVHMAYLQCALLHIPAVIVHGNTLSVQEYSRWYTPAHILDGWNFKLRREASAAREIERVEPRPAMTASAEDDPEQPQGPSQLTLF